MERSDAACPRLSADDLERFLLQTAEIWEKSRNARILVTGGTGFFGRWLLETYSYAYSRLALDSELTVLSRAPDNFTHAMPHLAGIRGLNFLTGDIRDFEFPCGQFDFVLHAATSSNAKENSESPESLFDTIVFGTRRVLDFAAERGAQSFLFVSSGAVYGRQPLEMSHIVENMHTAPDPRERDSSYGIGKLAAENMCFSHKLSRNCAVKSARCFAFVGPHLPLDQHFAIGNFISDALAGRPIEIAGDGRSVRSYLYASDLAVWLWTLLFRGTPGGAYNVGSERALSILELASLVNLIATGGALELNINCSGQPVAQPHRYVPSTSKARAELGLLESVSLEVAIRKTIDWWRLGEMASRVQFTAK